MHASIVQAAEMKFLLSIKKPTKKSKIWNQGIKQGMELEIFFFGNYPLFMIKIFNTKSYGISQTGYTSIFLW